ncbi:MAG: M3 family metallopeptidase [Candidatus Cloacimonadales bacterium]|nr:M3 family metallopeptidase [Candidatus Cloacimonadales bacterium]
MVEFSSQMADISKVVDIAKELNVLSVEYSKLSWVQYTVGFDLGVQAAYQKILNVLKDKTKYKVILDHLQKDLDPLDKRRVELIEKEFRNFHLSPELNALTEKMQKKRTELSQVLNTHRSKLNGKEINSVELQKIINESPDADKRKAAFLARTSVNKPLVEAGFIELLNMRKEYAQLYGAKNFVEYSLEQDELDPAIFASWPAELNEQLPHMQKVRTEFARKYLHQEEIKPWDAAFVSGKIAPELNKDIDMSGFYEPIRKIFAKFGIDISGDNTTYDVFPRKNKSEWGYNFTIKDGEDSRILANVQNRYTQFGVLLHETGHAMHSFRLDPDEMLLNRGVSGIISEGIANLFGGFLTEEIFFSEFFGIEMESARINFAALKKWEKINSLRAIERIFFDQTLYLNEIKNLDDIHNLKWKLQSELLGEKPYAEEPVWGFVIHHTTHPIYLHNYFMGDVTCEMLKEVFCRKHNLKSILEEPAAFGKFVVDEVIKPSGTYPYAELFKKISGEDFSLKYLKV